MRRNSRRYIKQQSRQNERTHRPFFQLSKDESKQHSFFQTQSNTGEKGDKYEKEADLAAEKVMSKPVSGSEPLVQRQDISSVGKDDLKDKEEKTAQKMDNKEEEDSTKKVDLEKDKPLKNADKLDEHNTVQKQEDEEEVAQTKAEDEREEEPLQAMQKSRESGSVKIKDISDRIKNTKGKGQAMPEKTVREMNKAFDVDFSKVVVHDDEESDAMNKEMRSLAFTNGEDIYFAKGQYNPYSTSGKALLAHELTHVVQQTKK